MSRERTTFHRVWSEMLRRARPDGSLERKARVGGGGQQLKHRDAQGLGVHGVCYCHTREGVKLLNLNLKISVTQTTRKHEDTQEMFLTAKYQCI